MKYIKKFEETIYTGKFLSEIKPRQYSEEDYSDEMRDKELIHNRLEISDWIEYYFENYNVKTGEIERHKEIGQIAIKNDPYLDSDIYVLTPNPTLKRGLHPNGRRLISSLNIIRKLEQHEIDAMKYNL